MEYIPKNNSFISCKEFGPEINEKEIEAIIPKSEKGSWHFVVTDLVGKTIVEQQAPANTRNLDLNIKATAGVYLITITNTATNKKMVQKVVVL